VNLRRADGRPLVIGHRGAAAVAPENTLESLAAAVDAGADVVEFDVGEGLLLGHSLEERPSSPVHLDEALALLAGRGVGVHVDLKLLGIENDVAAAVRRHGLQGRTLVSSNWLRSLRRLATTAPELTRAISYPRDRYHVSRLPWPQLLTTAGAAAARAAMPARVVPLIAAARADAVSLHHKLISPAVVRTARSRGAFVIAWTVNETAQIERVAAVGVDAVVTDDPARARSVLDTLNLP
jgi:glycerophosphoryl diester phosphodiesterase